MASPTTFPATPEWGWAWCPSESRFVAPISEPDIRDNALNLPMS
jgi:hypothetical protein